MISCAKSNNNLEKSAKTCDSNENGLVKRKLLLDSCLGSGKFPSRVLKLSNKKASYTEQAEMYKKNLEYTYLSYSNQGKPYKRSISTHCETILDAPNAIDDFCKFDFI